MATSEPTYCLALTRPQGGFGGSPPTTPLVTRFCRRRASSPLCAQETTSSSRSLLAPPSKPSCDPLLPQTSIFFLVRPGNNLFLALAARGPLQPLL
jgi:hypothetical protein